MEETRRKVLDNFKRRKGSYPQMGHSDAPHSHVQLSCSDGCKPQSPPLVRAPPLSAHTHSIPQHSSVVASTVAVSTSTRNVDLSEYQELPRTVTPTPPPVRSPPPCVNNVEIDRMEKRVKESLFGDFSNQTLSSSCSSLVNMDHAQLSYTRSVGQPSSSTSPSREREPPQPQCQSSDKSRKPIGVPHHQSMASRRDQSVPHSDSSEWTEYASAPLANSAETLHSISSGNLSTAANRTVVSEFDPYIGKL